MISTAFPVRSIWSYSLTSLSFSLFLSLFPTLSISISFRFIDSIVDFVLNNLRYCVHSLTWSSWSMRVQTPNMTAPFHSNLIWIQRPGSLTAVQAWIRQLRKSQRHLLTKPAVNSNRPVKRTRCQQHRIKPKEIGVSGSHQMIHQLPNVTLPCVINSSIPGK